MSGIKLVERKGKALEWETANTLLLDGEWGLETDTRKRKYGDGSTLWNDLEYKSEDNSIPKDFILEVTEGGIGSSSENPYIAGTNSESRLILRGAANGHGYVMLPGKNHFGDSRDFIGDQVYIVDTSYLGEGGYSHYIFSDNRVDGGNAPYSYIGRCTTKPLFLDDTPLTYNGNPIYGFTLVNFQHFEFEAYPALANESPTIQWVPMGKSALLLMENNDQSADGWGNDAKLNSAGMITRYTLSEGEYNTEILKNVLFLDADTQEVIDTAITADTYQYIPLPRGYKQYLLKRGAGNHNFCVEAGEFLEGDEITITALSPIGNTEADTGTLRFFEEILVGGAWQTNVAVGNTNIIAWGSSITFKRVAADGHDGWIPISSNGSHTLMSS